MPKCPVCFYEFKSNTCFRCRKTIMELRVEAQQKYFSSKDVDEMARWAEVEGKLGSILNEARKDAADGKIPD